MSKYIEIDSINEFGALCVETVEIEGSDVIIETGKIYRYKERGGVNWSLCKIIAIHKNKVWLENLSTFSCPVGRINKYDFVEVSSINDLIESKQ